MDENLFDCLFLVLFEWFYLSGSALCDYSGGEQCKQAVRTR